MDDRYLVGLSGLGVDDVERAGGKAALLGELTRVPALRVAPGFCVVTAVYRDVVAASPAIVAELDFLAAASAGGTADERGAADHGATVRRLLETVAVPDAVVSAIAAAVDGLGDVDCAVRSSATAEDQPAASFAGQHDSFLGVRGVAEIVDAMRRCWASLFTDRAIDYRNRHGIDHRHVAMAVVVQRLVDGSAAGVMFTADAVTSDRAVVSIEATPGLGAALVAGRVTPDHYRVRRGELLPSAGGSRGADNAESDERSAAAVAAEVAVGGGSAASARAESLGDVLTESEAVELAAIGRRIEATFGQPQDIEWCRDDDGFVIVQSRPITTLYPIPTGALVGAAEDTTTAVGDSRQQTSHSVEDSLPATGAVTVGRDAALRVYLSVGHVQMMTDPMPPLGLSLLQLAGAGTFLPAGSRLWVEATALLRSPVTRPGFLEMMGRSEALMRDAIDQVIERPGFLDDDDGAAPPPSSSAPAQPTTAPEPGVIAELIAENEASVAALHTAIAATSGDASFAFIVDDLAELKHQRGGPRSHQAIMAGTESVWWLNDHLAQWLGERNATDRLAQSAPGNVSAEMGLALLDVADAVRRSPAVVEYLETGAADDFVEHLPALSGGAEVAAALADYLERYGARCVGEIDITRARWAERPAQLVPLILANVHAFTPGEAQRRVERGLAEAAAAEHEFLERLTAGPDGVARAAETKLHIDRLRTLTGYREYPKYGMIRRFALYRQALLAEIDGLVADGVLTAVDDAYFLDFDELRAAVTDRAADLALIARRRAEFAHHATLVVPRVLTSDGEALLGSYRRGGAPDGALVGFAVSAGVVEGRARVLDDPAAAVGIEPGDILVTTFTDPSWSPLFVAVAGLVTEVGGLLSHGAVVAREYGLPAVVGVPNATTRIADGRRIRIDGGAGYVELLD